MELGDPFVQEELDAVRPEVDPRHRGVVEEEEPRGEWETAATGQRKLARI